MTPINRYNFRTLVLKKFKEKYPYAPFKKLDESIVPNIEELAAFGYINGTRNSDQWIDSMAESVITFLALRGAKQYLEEKKPNE